MAAKKKSGKGTKSTGGMKRPGIVLLLVVALLCGIFLLLEQVKSRYIPGEGEKPPVTEKHRLPPRTDLKGYEQRPYTSMMVAPPAKKARKKLVGHGSLAIIVDDMGGNLQEAKELLSIDLPITFSIIPGLPKVKAVAEAAHAKGQQVMIHMPMEPQGYPAQRMEKNGLLLSYSDDEIVHRLREYAEANPLAVGANNHMGSRFTENEPKMRTVLALLKEKGLFFVDSRTSPHSVGFALAEKMGLETGARNVFLDNVQEVAAIKTQLDEAVRIASRRGSAIAICHPHQTTIRALREAMPELHQAGITFVHASELVK